MGRENVRKCEGRDSSEAIDEFPGTPCHSQSGTGGIDLATMYGKESDEQLAEYMAALWWTVMV